MRPEYTHALCFRVPTIPEPDKSGARQLATDYCASRWTINSARSFRVSTSSKDWRRSACSGWSVPADKMAANR